MMYKASGLIIRLATSPNLAHCGRSSFFLSHDDGDTRLHINGGSVMYKVRETGKSQHQKLLHRAPEIKPSLLPYSEAT